MDFPLKAAIGKHCFVSMWTATSWEHGKHLCGDTWSISPKPVGLESDPWPAISCLSSAFYEELHFFSLRVKELFSLESCLCSHRELSERPARSTPPDLVLIDFPNSLRSIIPSSLPIWFLNNNCILFSKRQIFIAIHQKQGQFTLTVTEVIICLECFLLLLNRSWLSSLEANCPQVIMCKY